MSLVQRWASSSLPTVSACPSSVSRSGRSGQLMTAHGPGPAPAPPLGAARGERLKGKGGGWRGPFSAWGRGGGAPGHRCRSSSRIPTRQRPAACLPE